MTMRKCKLAILATAVLLQVHAGAGYLFAEVPQTRQADAITRKEKPTAADLSALIRDLKDKEPRVRAEAVRRLTALGEAAKPAIPALVEALRDSDAKVRYRSVIVLGKLWSGLESGPEIDAAVPALVKLIKDKDWYTRWRAMVALRMIGPAARAALPELDKIRHDRNDDLSSYASGAFDNIERPATDDVSTLAGLLKDKDPKVRLDTAKRLSSMGMKRVLLSGSFSGELAIPALIEALKDPDKQVRYHSLSTLSTFMYNPEPPDLGAAIPAATELLKDADSGTRWQAALTLGKIGPRARAAVPLLTQALSDEDKVVRSTAAFALGEIGQESRVAAPSLIKLLKDPSADARESAATALSKVEPGSASVVVAALSEDLKHEDLAFRGRAARALGSFGPEAKPAAPLLADMLKTEDYFWRHLVVQTLEKIGPGAHEAVPALRSVLNDRVGYIRVAAAIALLKIAPESESEIQPDLLKQAKEKIEKDEAMARAGKTIPVGIYRPDPGTEWDEASDLLSRGRQFEGQGKLDAAVASYTEAIEVDPQFADAYHYRGSAHRRRGDYVAAIADFTKAIQTDHTSDRSRSQRSYLSLGATQLDRRDYDAAIVDFGEVIRLNAYNAEAYYGRGLAYQFKLNFDAAIADYDRATKIVPPATKAFSARGAVKLAQGKVADALADFTEAVKADPKDADSYECLGDAYARQADTGQARDAWSKALDLSSEAKHKARLKGKLSGAPKQ